MAAHGGPFDLTLDFGYRVDPNDDPELQVRVTMSWEHALAIVKVLQGLVEGYQTQVGPVADVTHLREEA